MRLVSYGPSGKERCGILQGDRIIDLSRATQGLLHEPLPWDMVNFLNREHWFEVAQKVVEAADSLEEEDWVGISETRLGPPVPRPSKIIALGINYQDHGDEIRQGVQLPSSPILFSKASNSVTGPYDEVIYPPETQALDYEVELAVVVGRRAWRIKPEKAYAYIAGYMVLNDISARDLQLGGDTNLGLQWFRRKSFDTFAPMGPYLVTSEEVGDPHGLRIRLMLNGEVRQDSRTSCLHFKVPEILSFISHGITLFPGDVIATGTPSGVGFFSDPPRLLQVGDEMVAEIEQIGALKNRVVAEQGKTLKAQPRYQE